jgi:hypothetical protein
MRETSHGRGPHPGPGTREAPSDRDLTAPSAAASILLIPTVHVATRLVLGRKRPAAVRTRRPPMMSASAGRKL